MKVNLIVEVTDRSYPSLTDEQLSALRAALNQPTATIVENRKLVGGRGIVHVVQTMDDVVNGYGIELPHYP